MINDVVMADQICSFLSRKNYSFHLAGNRYNRVDGYAPLNQCSDSKFTWVKKWTDNSCDLISRYKNLIVVCPEQVEDINSIMGSDHTYIYCNEPKMIFFEVLEEFFVGKDLRKEISPTARIYSKRIGIECEIGEYSVISSETIIGDFVKIGSGVKLVGKVTIGNHCQIQSGTVIGENGFGYYKTPDAHFKQVPHLGGVMIGDYVDIGANTCIDRGTMEDTVIGDYSKIDNLVHIGHNVKIGKNVLIVAGVVLGGSSTIEDGAYIAPGAIIRNQITVAENSFIGMQSCVVKDVESDTMVLGVPAKEMKHKHD